MSNETGTQATNGVDETPALAADFEGAESSDIPPPNGEYDFTILRFTHKRSKKEGSLATYVDCQLQLDTEPARGRQLFDMLLTQYADGTVVGSPAAAANGLSRGNTAIGVLAALKLPANTLRTIGPISQVIGKQLRGKFRAELDEQSGDKKLRLKKVVGAPTGVAFTAKKGATAGAPAETF